MNDLKTIVNREIMRQRSRLYYIENRERLIERAKIRSKINRKPWSERADNPKNKRRTAFRKYFAEIKPTFVKNYMMFAEGVRK